MEKIKKTGIYQIYCKANGKSYYGQTNDYDRRMIEHKKNLRHRSGKKHHCVYLQNAWNLYGEDQFEFSLIEECPEDQLTIREQWYFDNYGPKDLLFNTALCAESTRRGVPLSEETKQKLRDFNLGPNNPNRGRKISDEHKKKLSIANKGSNHWHHGRPCTEEEKLKNSLSLRGENCYLAKLTWDQVYQLRRDFYERTKTVKEITQEFNMNKSTICDILKNKTWKDALYDPSENIKILEQGNKVVNKEIVVKIREDYKSDTYELEELAEKYGLTLSGVGKVIRNETWKDPEYAQWLKDNKKVIKKPVRINMEIANNIRADFNELSKSVGKEKCYIQISEKYDLASITVRKIVKNQMWV